MEKLLSSEEVADMLGTTKRVVCYTLKIPYIKTSEFSKYSIDELKTEFDYSKSDVETLELRNRNQVVELWKNMLLDLESKQNRETR